MPPTMAYSDKQLKASYLFSRQFLGIGEGKKDTQLLADQARKWEEECQRDIQALYGQTQSEQPIRRRLRIGYLSADFANVSWSIPTTSTQTSR